VWINEPWRDHKSVGVYLATTLPHVITDSNDPIPLYCDVASSR
jgi:hypothetical protein